MARGPGAARWRASAGLGAQESGLAGARGGKEAHVSEHLNALDATFLELEELDESAHMHIGAILVFDPQSDGGSPPHEAVCEHLSERLGRLPRYRQRLSARHTGGLSWPEGLDRPPFQGPPPVRPPPRPP